MLVTFIWGATFVLIKNALADMSPLLFNAVRMVLAAVALCAFYYRDLARLTPGAVKAGIVVGTFLWLGYEFQTTGLKLTTPSKSAFITGLAVVLVPVFLTLWHRKVSRWSATGVCAAFAGLYLMTVPASGGLGFDFSSINRGDLLTLGCAVAFAFQIIFVGRATEQFPFAQIAVVHAIVCAVWMGLSVPVLETSYALWSPLVIWAILITGLLCTAFAFAVQAWAQQFTPPTHTALIFSLEPVFAWITSYLLLGERLGGRATIGALLILGGVLVSELKGSAGRNGEAAEAARA